MDFLTRTQRDARAELHARFLFLLEQRLQPNFSRLAHEA